MVKNISVNSPISLQGFRFCLIIREIAYGNGFTDRASPPDCSVQALGSGRNLNCVPWSMTPDST